MSNEREIQQRYLSTTFASIFGICPGVVDVDYSQDEIITIHMPDLPDWSMEIGSDDEFYDFVSGDCSLIVPFQQNATT